MYLPTHTCHTPNGELPVYVDIDMAVSVEDGKITDIHSYHVNDAPIEDELIAEIEEQFKRASFDSPEAVKEYLKEQFGIYPASCPRLVKYFLAQYFVSKAPIDELMGTEPHKEA
jgi:hypothetical protein